MDMNKHDAGTEMEMNMTPMIDVVFLLIIFFMIITDLTQADLEQLQLPEAKSAVEDKPDPKVVRPII
ncbi:MAG TPA: biopolymer transporter ExbD, partial [Planctomycetes bacterium]|nr:biopolymer transporter ExbD [Planctomycetota bacterium]